MVAGGGATLYRAALAARESAQRRGADEAAAAGWKAVLSACNAPLQQIARNSGLQVGKAELLELSGQAGSTLDFATGEVIDARKAGVLDPVKVVVAALTHAASTAAQLVTAESVVVNVPDEAKS